MSIKTRSIFRLRVFVLNFYWLCIPGVLYAQKTPDKAKLAEYEREAKQLVSYFSFTLNVLGDPEISARDKDVVINESYLKMCRDAKVQVEDDLDDKREVVTNKDVQAYLKDVDFFFERVKFEFNIEEITNDFNENNQLFFTVKTNRNLRGITINGDSVNSVKERFFEINVDEENKDIKIVSVYTTKLDRNDEILAWWENLSAEWKQQLCQSVEIQPGLKLVDIQEFTDTSYVINGTVIPESINIISTIEKVMETTEVDISNNKILSDIRPLNELKKLTTLNISNTNVDDLFPVRNLTNIETLDCSNTGVNDLTPIRYSRSLKSLNIRNTVISDISMLEGFTQLEKLQVDSTNISDLSSVTGLSKLKTLTFAGTSVRDLPDLKKLSGLEHLDMSGTPVHKLDEVSKLSNIKILCFSHTPVLTLEPLKEMQSLQEVRFDETMIDDISILYDLKDLKRVYCDKTAIALEEYQEMHDKNPDCKMIFMTEGLQEFWTGLDPEWKTAYKITDEGKEPSREELHQILDVESLNLKDKKNITSLSPAEFALNLREIDFSGTMVSEVAPLSQLLKLQRIDGSDTRVSDISSLEELSQLQTIKFNNTSIENINDLKRCFELDSLYFNNTQVGNIEVLNSIKGFSFASFEGAKVTDNEFAGLRYHEDSAVVMYRTEALYEWWGNMPDAWQNMFRKTYNLDKRPEPVDLHRIAGKQTLSVSGTSIRDLEALRSMVRLREFSLTDSNVKSLAPIENLKGLKELKCPRNPITDLGPIANLIGLKILDIESTQVNDLMPVAGLIDLEIIKLSGTSVKDLSPLSYLNNLKELEFSKTKVRNIKPLENLTNLEVMKCYNNNISPKRVDEFKARNPECEVVFY